MTELLASCPVAARRKASLRHGGARQRYDLLEGDLVAFPAGDELLDLDAALDKLATVDSQAAQLVKLRVFAGMTMDEIAHFLGLSPRSAKRVWAYARAWLGRELADHAARSP